MAIRRVVLVGAALAVIGMTSPAAAGWCGPAAHRCYWRLHHALYQARNYIAYLEADPDVSDGFKAAEIRAANTAIRHLRARLGPPHWHRRWAAPCCYSRPRIYIR